MLWRLWLRYLRLRLRLWLLLLLLLLEKREEGAQLGLARLCGDAEQLLQLRQLLLLLTLILLLLLDLLLLLLHLLLQRYSGRQESRLVGGRWLRKRQTVGHLLLSLLMLLHLHLLLLLLVLLVLLLLLLKSKRGCQKTRLVLVKLRLHRLDTRCRLLLLLRVLLEHHGERIRGRHTQRLAHAGLRVRWHHLSLLSLCLIWLLVHGHEGVQRTHEIILVEVVGHAR